jgi:hypothetical protein
MQIKLFLKNIWHKWQKVVKVITYYNTILLLGLAFYTIFTIYGIFVRLLRKDILDLRMKKDNVTYWEEKETIENTNYKQY